jgi:hypothetical protein
MLSCCYPLLPNHLLWHGLGTYPLLSHRLLVTTSSGHTQLATTHNTDQPWNSHDTFPEEKEKEFAAQVLADREMLMMWAISRNDVSAAKGGGMPWQPDRVLNTPEQLHG